MNDFTIAAKVRKLVRHSLFSDATINELVKPFKLSEDEEKDAGLVAAKEKAMVDKVYARAEELMEKEGDPKFGHDPARAIIVHQSIKTLRTIDPSVEREERAARFEARIATDRRNHTTFDESA